MNDIKNKAKGVKAGLPIAADKSKRGAAESPNTTKDPAHDAVHTADEVAHDAGHEDVARGAGEKTGKAGPSVKHSK